MPRFEDEGWLSLDPVYFSSGGSRTASAASFDNPDLVEVTIHSYRRRYANAPGDPGYADLERSPAAKRAGVWR